MLKITAIGNLTNDVELKMNETTGKPYAILRIASDRRYKDIPMSRNTTYFCFHYGSSHYGSSLERPDMGNIAYNAICSL